MAAARDLDSRNVSRAPTEPSAETSWGGTKKVLSWADAQESDEEMEGTEETSKRRKVQVIGAAHSRL